MTLDGKMLRSLFKHEWFKPAIIKASQGNVFNLLQLKQILNIGMRVKLLAFHIVRHIYYEQN